MAQHPARRAALAALQVWTTEGGRADSILTLVLDQERPSRSDRALALELFYGVLRNLLLLDFWIGCLRPARLEPLLRDVVRLGLYQLLLLAMPEHAAVNETVELAPPKGRGLVNAVLRTAARERDELRRRAQGQPPSVRQSHPDFLISRWQKQFGFEATTALCKWNNTPPAIYGRVNGLKIDAEQFRHRYPASEPTPWPQFVKFQALPDDALARGHCYIQDPSTAIAPQLCDPQPEEKVLDACAAPGGKTGHLIELMHNRGIVVAADRDARRLRIVEQNLSRLGAKICHLVQHDWETNETVSKFEEFAPFDRLLIDAPCTNTGVMRRRVDVRWRLRPDDFIRMQKRQVVIVEQAARLLKPGGVIVYSTCSLEPEENELVVNRLVQRLPGAALVQQNSSRPFQDECDGAFAAKLIVKGAS